MSHVLISCAHLKPGYHGPHILGVNDQWRGEKGPFPGRVCSGSAMVGACFHVGKVVVVECHLRVVHPGEFAGKLSICWGTTWVS